VRILIFHGYLLRGTGSNVYNASLARALVALGHEVHLVCQDRDAAELNFVDAVDSFEPGARCTVHLPDIGRVLPVFVADRYDHFDAVPFPDLDDRSLAHYLDANVAAVREVVERARPEAALANHLIMGPAILARAVGGRIPYAVKAHGSDIEYTIRPHPDRFLPYAREGLAAARGVLVGSRHTAEALWSVVDEPGVRATTRLGPPGVDTHAFRPRPGGEAAAALRSLVERLEGAAAGGWGAEAGAAAALRKLDPERDEIVSYVGKLIVSKGVDLLLAAWPLVHERAPAARLCVVGFGTYRQALERLAAALGAGDLDAAREIAARGRELEGGPRGELAYLAAFLDGLRGERRARYATAGGAAMKRVHFTGRLDHEDLPDLLPGCEAQVVPSTFPEAFGMVAVEAAACGALPISAAHSGLAEVTRTFEPAIEPPLGRLLSFELGAGVVEEIAAKLSHWLELAPAERAPARAALSRAARERYGWEGVAQGVIAAAEGRLDELPVPGEPAGPPARGSG
jgi:glycosyltransferase involved in cell wall biosynthesis